MPHRGVRDRLPESKLVVIVEHTRIATDGTTVETIESPYHLLEHRDGVREDERSLRSRWTNQSYANADSLNGGAGNIRQSMNHGEPDANAGWLYFC
jgi:hypothetical protein